MNWSHIEHISFLSSRLINFSCISLTMIHTRVMIDWLFLSRVNCARLISAPNQKPTLSNKIHSTFGVNSRKTGPWCEYRKLIKASSWPHLWCEKEKPNIIELERNCCVFLLSASTKSAWERWMMRFRWCGFWIVWPDSQSFCIAKELETATHECHFQQFSTHFRLSGDGVWCFIRKMCYRKLWKLITFSVWRNTAIIMQ